MTNPIDWLEITIKFRGKCCECGKEITSGQAFWSKSTKAVKHLDCHFRSTIQGTSTTMNLQEYVSREPEKKGFSALQRRLQQTIELKCFICGNKTTYSNEYDDPLTCDDYYKNKSHAYICEPCLKREDVYEAYQESFMQKMNKYLK